MEEQTQKMFNVFSRAEACVKMQKIYPELSEGNIHLGYLSVCNGRQFFLNVLCFYAKVKKEDLPFKRRLPLPEKTEAVVLFIRVERTKDVQNFGLVPLECVIKEKICSLGETVMVGGTPYHYRSFRGNRILNPWL